MTQSTDSRPVWRALPLVVFVLLLCGIVTFGVVRLISVEIEDAASDTTAALVVNTATPTVEVQQPTAVPTEVVFEVEPTAVPPRPTRDIQPVFGVDVADEVEEAEEAEEAPAVEEPAAEVDPAPEVEETAPEPEMVSEPDLSAGSAPILRTMADVMDFQVTEGRDVTQLEEQVMSIPGAISITAITVPAGADYDLLPYMADIQNRLDTEYAVNGNLAAFSLNASNVSDLPNLYSVTTPVPWIAENESEFLWGAPFGTVPTQFPKETVRVPTAGQIQLQVLRDEQGNIVKNSVQLRWVFMPNTMERPIDGYNVQSLFSPNKFNTWNWAADNDLTDLPEDLRNHMMYALWTNKSELVTVYVRYTYPDGRVGCYTQDPNNNTTIVFVELGEGEWCSGWSAEMAEGVIIDLILEVDGANTTVNFDLGAAGQKTNKGIYPPMVAANGELLQAMINQVIEVEGTVPVQPTPAPEPTAYP